MEEKTERERKRERKRDLERQREEEGEKERFRKTEREEEGEKERCRKTERERDCWSMKQRLGCDVPGDGTVEEGSQETHITRLTSHLTHTHVPTDTHCTHAYTQAQF